MCNGGGGAAAAVRASTANRRRRAPVKYDTSRDVRSTPRCSIGRKRGDRPKGTLPMTKPEKKNDTMVPMSSWGGRGGGRERAVVGGEGPPRRARAGARLSH